MGGLHTLTIRCLRNRLERLRAMGFSEKGMVVCTENLNPDVVMMNSAKDGERFHASSPLNRAKDLSLS
jgi:hypothetical protein